MGTEGRPQSDPVPAGSQRFLVAIDAQTGKLRWQTKIDNGGQTAGGVLIADGKVISNRTCAQGKREFCFIAAHDAKTGKELWKFQTGSGINASPITYELDGKQYVAVLSGLGGDPSFYFSSPKGGMLWVFAIDGKVDEGQAYNAEVIEKMLPSYKP